MHARRGETTAGLIKTCSSLSTFTILPKRRIKKNVIDMNSMIISHEIKKYYLIFDFILLNLGIDFTDLCGQFL